MHGLRIHVPAELHELADLAVNLWWTWHPSAAELFRSLAPERWVSCGRNPVKLLRDAPARDLDRMAADATLLARVHAIHEEWIKDRDRPTRPDFPATRDRPIAFFCAEFGVDPALATYSGGLGVLAGDVLKQASDMAIPMVGVGLFYRRGYFHQRLDRSGWQHEYWTTATPEELPMVPELASRNARVHLRLRDRSVAARIWRVDVGRIPLYLLDTDVPENDPVSRWITSTLYVGDRAMRLMQYAVLALGGVRALRTLGVDPSVFHINEGHASLVSLELIRERRALGEDFHEALANVRSQVVFTTHTPVAAGNEHYSEKEVQAVLGALSREIGIDNRELTSLARGGAANAHDLGVTELALRTARSTNAVSRRHGEVTRGMWQHIWPGRAPKDVPITHVTNGVHGPTWMAAPMRALLARHLGPDFFMTPDPAMLKRVHDIPDEEIWRVRDELRGRLVGYVRDKSIADRLARGETIAYAEGAMKTFEPDVLTIGFARRVASYKRLNLLIHDPERALSLLANHPVQVVMAGRAHPMDDGAKRLVQAIFSLKDTRAAATHVAFVEDYDMAVAKELVAGCDVWLNLPRAPLEASGTSGMKAALNGGLNVSVLDGWWLEAYDDGVNGWGIASTEGLDEAAQDARDASTLYSILEREVVPSFYARDDANLPRAWVQRIKASIERVLTTFTTRRMLEEYTTKVWSH